MSRQPGEVIHQTKRGVEVIYSPSMGSSTTYRVVCPHGEAVNARTQAEAQESATLVNEWCMECARYMPPSTDDERERRLNEFARNPGWVKEMRS